MLSWRVMLLPYLGHADLYDKFKLDEPWDSAHNKPLSDQMPSVYRSLSTNAKLPGKTTYLAPIGKGLLFSGDKQGIGLRDVTDGTSNTIAILQADENHAVPWASPQDLAVDLKKPADGLVEYPGAGALVGISDGRVATLRKGIADKSLAALFTRNGNDEAPSGPPDVVAANLGREPARGRNGLGLFGFGLGDQEMDALGLPNLVLKGLGNQVGLHVYDTSPLFDFNLPSFLGESARAVSTAGAGE